MVLLSLGATSAEIDVWLIAGTDVNLYPDSVPAAYEFLHNAPNVYIYWNNSEKFNVNLPQARTYWPDNYTHVNSAYRSLFDRTNDLDVVILNGLNASFWNQSQWQALVDWVYHGGSLITIGGWASYGGQDVIYFADGTSYDANLGNWDETPIKDALPVKIFRNPDSVERYPVQPNYAPPTHLFKLQDDPLFDYITWDDPYIIGYHLLAPKSNATMLAHFDDGSPAIVKWNYGLGSVLSFSFGIDEGWGGIEGTEYDKNTYFRWWYYAEQLLYNAVVTVTNTTFYESTVVITSIETPKATKVNEIATVVIRVKNIGEYTVKNVKLTFTYPSERFGSDSPSSIILGDISPNKEIVYTLYINCTQKGHNTFIISLDGMYAKESYNSTTVRVYEKRDFFFDLREVISIIIISCGLFVSFMIVKNGKYVIKSVKCENCGARISNVTSEFCSVCGAPTTKQCLFCKNMIPIAAKHCAACGTTQETSEPDQAKSEKRTAEDLFPEDVKKEKKVQKNVKEKQKNSESKEKNKKKPPSENTTKSKEEQSVENLFM